MSSMFFHIKNPFHNEHFMKVKIKLLKYLSLSSCASLLKKKIPVAYVIAFLCFFFFLFFPTSIGRILLKGIEPFRSFGTTIQQPVFKKNKSPIFPHPFCQYLYQGAIQTILSYNRRKRYEREQCS